VNGDQANNFAKDSGAAYVFVRTGQNWRQQAYLKASNTGGDTGVSPYGDSFGSSLAISGNLLTIGALGESSSATGLNGSQTDNSAANAGAAYAFVRRGTNWSQVNYLKASNTDAGDQFGISVAVSGETVVVGANGEGSNATGINGNQNDNTVPASGAAYVFAGVGIGPQLTIAADLSTGYFIRFTGVPDVRYHLERGASVSGPWETIASLTTPVSALVEFHDMPPPGHAFYRTLQP